MSGDEREYYIRVYAEGDTGHQAQTYQLQVNFSEACFPDSYEEDFLNNNIMTATIGRDGTTGNVTARIFQRTFAAVTLMFLSSSLMIQQNNETITVTPGGDITVSLGDVNGDLATPEDSDGGDGFIEPHLHPRSFSADHGLGPSGQGSRRREQRLRAHGDH